MVGSNGRKKGKICGRTRRLWGICQDGIKGSENRKFRMRVKVTECARAARLGPHCIFLIAGQWRRSQAPEVFVAESGHQIRCKWARRMRIDDAVRILHMSGNLAPAPCGCSWTHRRKPPPQIEGPLLELAKKIL